MPAADPAAGVLSLQLESLTGLPPRGADESSVVQIVATLLQGSRREQRTSAPLQYAGTAEWAEDEVLEFGGVLQSARLFFDVYAHRGVSLPADGVPASAPTSSTLLGKVAVCVDELAVDTPLRATRRLLVGSVRFRIAYTCIQGVPSRPVTMHAPPLELRLRADSSSAGAGGRKVEGTVEGACSRSLSPLSSAGVLAVASPRPRVEGAFRPPYDRSASCDSSGSMAMAERADALHSLPQLGEKKRLNGGRGGASSPVNAGMIPSVKASESARTLDELVTQLSEEQAIEATTIDPASAKEALAQMSPIEAARVLRHNRVLNLLASRSLSSPSVVLMGLAKQGDGSAESPETVRRLAPEREKIASAGQAQALCHGRRNSGPSARIGQNTMPSRPTMAGEGWSFGSTSEYEVERIRGQSFSDMGHIKSANRLFDDSEFSEYVSEFTREDHLERIESPGKRARRSTFSLQSHRPMSCRNSNTNSAADCPETLSCIAVTAQNIEAAARTASLLRPPSSFKSTDGADLPQTVDSVAMSAVPITESVSKGPHDPQVFALLNAYAPGKDGKPAPHLLDWDFNILELEEVLGPATLPFVVVQYMRTLPLLAQLDVDPLELAAYLSYIGSSYRPLSYHSVMHGADAFHALIHFLEGGLVRRKGTNSTDTNKSKRSSREGEAAAAIRISRCEEPAELHGPHEWQLTDAELLGLLVGIAAHDVDHTGQNNAFHVATGSELAITYNDVSVLENHHCAFAFRALNHAGRNFARNLDSVKYKEFRETVIAVILGTDMSKHFDHVAHLNSTVAEGGHPLDLAAHSADRRFLMQTAAHAADISNSCRQTAVAITWSERVTREFYAQGDREKELGMPVTRFFDRHSRQLAKSQLGFFDFIVKPLFEPLSKLLHVEHLLAQLEINREHWAALLAEDEADDDAKELERIDSNEVKELSVREMQLRSPRRRPSDRRRISDGAPAEAAETPNPLFVQRSHYLENYNATYSSNYDDSNLAGVGVDLGADLDAATATFNASVLPRSSSGMNSLHASENEDASSSSGLGSSIGDVLKEADFGDPGALPPPTRLTASALAAAAGFSSATHSPHGSVSSHSSSGQRFGSPRHATHTAPYDGEQAHHNDEVGLGQNSPHGSDDHMPHDHPVVGMTRARSNSVTSIKSQRDRRPSVASIPEEALELALRDRGLGNGLGDGGGDELGDGLGDGLANGGEGGADGGELSADGSDGSGDGDDDGDRNGEGGGGLGGGDGGGLGVERQRGLSAHSSGPGSEAGRPVLGGPGRPEGTLPSEGAELGTEGGRPEEGEEGLDAGVSATPAGFLAEAGAGMVAGVGAERAEAGSHAEPPMSSLSPLVGPGQQPAALPMDSDDDSLPEGRAALPPAPGSGKQAPAGFANPAAYPDDGAL
mmetsp:Transcript_43419/g.107326  ORF Transcript_43419/g.107326 Transcript_43419/m.107326 type:complete len:1401 (-) Transcript_43419:84-4286(-)